MKKKTAVEWLVEQMFGEHTKAWQKQIDQAKAMEKEQIVKAFNEGTFANDEKVKAEQYFNEAYNTDTP
jgi:hypothetical protein